MRPDPDHARSWQRRRPGWERSAQFRVYRLLAGRYHQRQLNLATRWRNLFAVDEVGTRQERAPHLKACRSHAPVLASSIDGLVLR